MKKYSFLLAALLFVMFSVLEVYAFFIPSAMQLLGVSLSNIISYLIIILSAFFISMFGIVKTHLRNKKVIIASLFILTITLGSWFLLSEYNELKGYNIRSQEEGMDQLIFYNSALGVWTLEEDNNLVSLTFKFFDNYADENPSKIYNFSHEGERLDMETTVIHVSPMMETMMKTEKVCVEGYLNEMRINECSPDCIELGRGSCFYIYVMDIFDNLMSGEYARRFNINEMTLEEVSQNVIITPHLSDELVAKFTNLNVDARIWIDALGNLDYFNSVLKPYKNETILFMCYAGHSSSVMATMANLLGYNAVHVAFQDITNDEIVDVEGLQQVNQASSIIINDYRNRGRFRNSLYLMIEGMFDEKGYGDHATPIVGTMENGKLVFPGVDDDDLLNSNIICGTKLSCRIIQYWLSDRGLAEDINEIYIH